eukprot:gene15770-18021_t
MEEPEDTTEHRSFSVALCRGHEGILEDAKPNAIRTTKYTALTWLPKSVLEQFRRTANAYFLGISVLMILGSYATFLFISPLDPFSTIAVLIVILLITSCKEGYEDLLRRKSDKIENNRDVTVVTFEEDGSGMFVVREEVKTSKHLHPGEIVKLSGKMPAPADLLVILTSLHDDGNKFYVETANIDGETNLKLREGPSALNAELSHLVADGKAVPELFRGNVRIEAPNANIHKVVGMLKLDAAAEPIPFDEGNIVLRGALFSNTEWAYGVVLYTGQETKIQMNSMHAPSKMSKLEQNLNTAILMIFCAQVVLVSVSVLSVYLLGFDDTSKLPYVFPPGTGTGSILPLWLELWFVFFLLYNNFIPLSLYVTIEIVNVGQAYLMTTDEQMYHEGLDVACCVRASNLVQELGMVSNIFTDKTGTLTCNEMRLVKYVLKGKIFDMPAAPIAVGESVNINTDSISSVAPVPLEEMGQESATSGPTLTTTTPSQIRLGSALATGQATTPRRASSKPGRVRLQRANSDVSSSSEEDEEKAGDRTGKGESESGKGKASPARKLVFPASPNRSSTAASSNDHSKELFNFLRCLMTCHTVVRESNGTYRAESPDELALVQGATGGFDCQLVERGSREMTVCIDGQNYTYTILAVNAFNADRKRMSVLLKDNATGEYLLLCKGADNIMLPLCNVTPDEDVSLNESLTELSNMGLRTLVVAQRVISSTEAQAWLKMYRSSMVATSNRDELIAAAGAQIELKMEVVGVTAIEDKLQDEVPEVISDLTKAGIIVWMLTGDKLETAVNIGRSCNLILPDTHVLTISNLEGKEDFAESLRLNHHKILTLAAFEGECGGVGGGGKVSSNNFALVLDGPSFSFFDRTNPEQCAQLLEIGRRCRSVVACRLTPMQKRELVNLTKEDLSAVPRATTLAIGDGANDVSMILEANVGVGIFGKEGRQAANNADFAIGEFKFLRRLLLVHGRWNYVRQSKVFLYSMHKNMVLTMTLFWFSFFTAVSGCSPYESWVYSAFNFILGLPIIFFGILDRDLSADFCLSLPQTYSTGRTNVLLNIGSILQWIGNAMMYAVVVCLMSYNVLFPTFYFLDLYTAGTIVMIGLVIALQFKVMFFHHQWSSYQIHSMLFSFYAMFLFYMLIAASVDDYWNYAIMTYNEPITWLWGLFTVPFTAVFIDWFAYFSRYFLFPTQEMIY